MSKQLNFIDSGVVEYGKAWQLQKNIYNDVLEGRSLDTLIFLEHPHTYTMGKTTDKSNLTGSEEFLKNNNIAIFEIDRGGDITYHGPGQLVGYPILNLTGWLEDAHKYLRNLEEVLIKTCVDYGLTAGRIKGLTGVWIEDRKIAAIGIKISRWVTMHGFAFNINTDLSLFDGIIPCGIKDKKVTSLSAELRKQVNLIEVKERVLENFLTIFEYTNKK
ncbi:MAG: lipoyl(octanoyl) transferase LipB [Ignavibacteriaceae bacterium]|nr:lipoyl(octanoyl) transferase LipB [Ignavibacteriaceae bacterium]